MGAEAVVPVQFHVTVHEPELIAPEVPTENQLYFLSNLDQNIAIIVQTVYLFDANPDKAGEDPVKIIRDALRNVLVHYYPLAGRLGISPEGKLNVHCNDQGVVFVAAEADTVVSSLGSIVKPDATRLGKLVYQVPGAKHILEMPPLTVQVTKFQCGGFVLGLAMNHCIYDGIAAMEFVNAWGETARGVPITTLPVLDRSVLKARVPPQISFPHHEFLQVEDLSKKQDSSPDGEELEFKAFCFSPENLENLKKAAMEDGTLVRCTTFEVLSALVWRSRTKAMGMLPDQQTKLLFSVDGRNRISPPLPKGYMGNGILLTYAITSAQELAEMPLSAAVKKVQEGIALITDDYIRSAIDYFEVTRARPTLAATMLITAWSKLTFYATDFGWGEPVHSGPVSLPEQEVVLFLSNGNSRKSMNSRKSINVLLGLAPRAMESFDKLMQTYL